MAKFLVVLLFAIVSTALSYPLFDEEHVISARSAYPYPHHYHHHHSNGYYPDGNNYYPGGNGYYPQPNYRPHYYNQGGYYPGFGQTQSNAQASASASAGSNRGYSPYGNNGDSFAQANAQAGSFGK